MASKSNFELIQLSEARKSLTGEADVIETGNALYEWFGLNESLFLFINKIHAPVLDQFLLLVTWLGHPRLFAFYLVFVLVLTWRKPEVMPWNNVVVFAVSYAVTSVLLVPIIKVALDFPRPLAVLGEQSVIVLGSPDTVHSFPSGHSAYAVLTAASLSPGIPRRAKQALIIFALLVCVSRISVGAHYPADVLGGAALSILVVSTVRFVINLQRNRLSCQN